MLCRSTRRQATIDVATAIAIGITTAVAVGVGQVGGIGVGASGGLPDLIAVLLAAAIAVVAVITATFKYKNMQWCEVRLGQYINSKEVYRYIIRVY